MTWTRAASTVLAAGDTSPEPYRIFTRLRAAVISLSVSLSGSICAPLVAEDLLEQLASELPLRKPQEDLAFAGPRVRLANAGLAQLADHRRVFDGPLELRASLPAKSSASGPPRPSTLPAMCRRAAYYLARISRRSEEHTSELQSLRHLV